MESHLLHAAFLSRDSFDLIQEYLNPKSYSREFQVILAKIKEYYERDTSSRDVNRDIFVEILSNAIPNEKHQVRFRGIVDEALGMESSVENIDELIIGARKGEVSDKLAVLLANRDPKAADLVEEYNRLNNLSSLADLNPSEIEFIRPEDMAAVIEDITTGRGTLRLYPLALDRRVESGVRGGHHITTYATPEMGKSALNITLAAGFARQGSRGLYFINEDPAKNIYFRLLSCMSGMTKSDIQANPGLAMDRARTAGIDNVTIVSLAPGTLNEIDAMVDGEGAEWSVLDQLLNIKVKAESRTNELEIAARGYRNILKKRNIPGVSTTQAGDSAEGKALLTMGDVYMSNTGIPGAADVMLGIGATSEQMQQGYRTISVPKNKINGDHNPVLVRFNPTLSRYSSE